MIYPDSWREDHVVWWFMLWFNLRMDLVSFRLNGLNQLNQMPMSKWIMSPQKRWRYPKKTWRLSLSLESLIIFRGYWSLGRTKVNLFGLAAAFPFNIQWSWSAATFMWQCDIGFIQVLSIFPFQGMKCFWSPWALWCNTLPPSFHGLQRRLLILFYLAESEFDHQVGNISSHVVKNQISAYWICIDS